VTRVAEQLLHDPNAPRDGRRALDEYIEHALVGWRRFLCPRVESLPEAA
jgi:hypothetical protein